MIETEEKARERGRMIERDREDSEKRGRTIERDTDRGEQERE